MFHLPKSTIQGQTKPVAVNIRGMVCQKTNAAGIGVEYSTVVSNDFEGRVTQKIYYETNKA